jgi:hypothetical protein
MNKLVFSTNYESPKAEVIEVQVEFGFQISGGGTGESGLPDEEM